LRSCPRFPATGTWAGHTGAIGPDVIDPGAVQATDLILDLLAGRAAGSAPRTDAAGALLAALAADVDHDQPSSAWLARPAPGGGLARVRLVPALILPGVWLLLAAPDAAAGGTRRPK
jgi:hypothetical protein